MRETAQESQENLLQPMTIDFDLDSSVDSDLR